MNVIKRVTALIGVVALMVSSLLAGNAAAQIDTTITILADCTDATPSSLTLSQSGGAENLTFGTLGGAGTWFTNKEMTGSLYMDLYVNECVKSWTVTASMTDFVSGTNSVSADFINMYHPQNCALCGTNFTLPVHGTGPYTVANQVEGTTGLLSGGNGVGGYDFVSAGTGISNLEHTVSTGGESSTGQMQQQIKLGIGFQELPQTTPPGTYESDLVFTFTPAF